MSEAATEARNAAFEEAAKLVADHKGEIFVGIGGNMGWRPASQQLLAQDILALRTPDEASMKQQQCLQNGASIDWVEIAKLAGRHGIRYATNAGLEAFLADVVAIGRQDAEVDSDAEATGPATPWRAYPGASWPQEPVEADHVGSFGTLEEAKAECERYRRGGFGDFVIHETTREVWKRSAGQGWVRLASARAR